MGQLRTRRYFKFNGPSTFDLALIFSDLYP